MLISEAIKQLQEIHAKYGDIEITGGYMNDNTPLREISVTDTNGVELYPVDRRRNRNIIPKIDGVFLTS